jgi:hypothetical protein
VKLAALGVSLLAVVGLSLVSSASVDPGWLVRCDYTHQLHDDPIVYPNQSGAAHLHTFLGNASTTATSTYASMTAAAGCSGLAADTAGYWAPALYRNGIEVLPQEVAPPNGTDATYHAREQVYYRELSPTVAVLPPNFAMVAGNSHATSVADNPYLGKELYWGCSDNTPDVKATAPINCASGIVALHIGFPSCWDGTMPAATGGPQNMTAHVSYPDNTTCPPAFPIAIPRIIMRLEYPLGTDSSGITLAGMNKRGGFIKKAPTYTVHGDFWNTWQQPVLARLTNDCLNSGVDCGTNPP